MQLNSLSFPPSSFVSLFMLLSFVRYMKPASAGIAELEEKESMQVSRMPGHVFQTPTAHATSCVIRR